MLNKHSINITNQDHRGWFINQYVLSWIKKHEPTILDEANDKFDKLIQEHEAETQTEQLVQEKINT